MLRIGNSILKFLPAGELEIVFYGNLGAAAHTDALTRIYNKGYLLEALDAEFKRAKALHTDFSLIFFDLDHFKRVNDTFGHDAGDHVLKEIARIVRADILGPRDIFARYGGEEFVILLANRNASERRTARRAHSRRRRGARVRLRGKAPARHLQHGRGGALRGDRIAGGAAQECRQGGLFVEAERTQPRHRRRLTGDRATGADAARPIWSGRAASECACPSRSSASPGWCSIIVILILPS